MKRRLLLTLSVIAILALVGLFVRLAYFWGETISIRDVRTEETITVQLKKELVSNIRFHVTGQIDGPATIYWNCPDKIRQTCKGERRFEGGKIDLDGRTDWYDRSYTFVYEPSLEVKTGSISIRYE